MYYIFKNDNYNLVENLEIFVFEEKSLKNTIINKIKILDDKNEEIEKYLNELKEKNEVTETQITEIIEQREENGLGGKFILLATNPYVSGTVIGILLLTPSLFRRYKKFDFSKIKFSIFKKNKIDYKNENDISKMIEKIINK
jgi:hypothetical protein